MGDEIRFPPSSSDYSISHENSAPVKEQNPQDQKTDNTAKTSFKERIYAESKKSISGSATLSQNIGRAAAKVTVTIAKFFGQGPKRDYGNFEKGRAQDVPRQKVEGEGYEKASMSIGRLKEKLTEYCSEHGTSVDNFEEDMKLDPKEFADKQAFSQISAAVRSNNVKQLDQAMAELKKSHKGEEPEDAAFARFNEHLGIFRNELAAYDGETPKAW